MTREACALAPDDTLERLWLLMERGGFRHVPVVDRQGSLVGVVSQRDLLRHRSLGAAGAAMPAGLAELAGRARVAEIMTGEVEAVSPDETLVQAARVMHENRYGCLPVVADARLVGILTEADLVRWVAAGSPGEGTAAAAGGRGGCRRRRATGGRGRMQ
jgi:CBS domain-containing membrane protein